MNIAKTEITSTSATMPPEQAKQKARLAVEMARHMPFVRIVGFEEGVDNSAVEWEFLAQVAVSLDLGHLVVKPLSKGDEIYYAAHGTHTVYGNFLQVWSVRGPGNGPRQRPMFLFYDKEPVFL